MIRPSSHTYVHLNKQDGGLMIVPIEEIGLITTLMTNTGSEESPKWVQDPERAYVHIKCMSMNVVVLHRPEDVLTSPNLFWIMP